MGARESILGQIKDISLPSKELPLVPIFEGFSDNKEEYFLTMLAALGVEVIISDQLSDLEEVVAERAKEGEVYSNVEGIPSVENISSQLNLSVINGSLGVAENGAIWVDGDQLKERYLTAIASHLMIVLPYQKLVWNMHEAYTYINPEETGYGVFISGPSKTADIEQSLVKGAHGAKSLTVFLHKK
ncbi:L-lactate dehydrogenase [Flammeovirga pectinis]|uniref:L-lactate dehydrogenase n=1 Tax=Flammeovirga pectinis TaxID=2494373 RepID=A0A3S9P9S7_9BACT|nr:LUD domain-containing protein [Flammeovirga pectinis]AZQ64961.1 L-lactate dehydrogenase [Flammeovirga pectinis]